MSDTSTYARLSRNKSTLTLPRLNTASTSPSRPASRHHYSTTAAHRRSLRRGLITGALVVLGAAGAGAAAYALSGQSHSDDVAHETAPQKRSVQVVKPTRATAGELKLPATLLGYQSTDIYARTNGYLKAWHVDIGDEVTEGQLLAELDTPELDQELLQSVAQEKQAEASVAEAIAQHAESKEQLQLAQAQIERAEAQFALAQTTHARNTPLAARQAISTQELDESAAMLAARKAETSAAKAQLAGQNANVATREATIESRKATLANAQANVLRIQRLQGFQKLTAPFSGVITRRDAEVGKLVSAGATGQTALYSLSQQDRLRVQIAVPQAQSSRIAVGQSATLSSPEHPSKAFTGSVTRTASFVDPKSRTLNVEIELPNENRELLPGGYAEVRLAMLDRQGKLRIPTSTLLQKSEGVFAAVVDRDSAIRLVKLTLGRDYGAEVEVAEGLSDSDSLVINPPDDLANGELVAFNSKPQSE